MGSPTKPPSARKAKKKPAAGDGDAAAVHADQDLLDEQEAANGAALLAEAMTSFRTPEDEDPAADTKPKEEPAADTKPKASPTIAKQGSGAQTSHRSMASKQDGNGELRTPLTDRNGGHDITVDNWEQRSKAVAELMMQNEKAEQAAIERIASYRGPAE